MAKAENFIFKCLKESVLFPFLKAVLCIKEALRLTQVAQTSNILELKRISFLGR